MRVILEFVGGPMDGTVTLERMPKQGEEFASFDESVVAMAYFQTRGEVGKRFRVLSRGRLASTVVRVGGDQVFPSFIYEVTHKLPDDDEIADDEIADDEMLIRAKYVKQSA